MALSASSVAWRGLMRPPRRGWPARSLRRPGGRRSCSDTSCTQGRSYTHRLRARLGAALVSPALLGIHRERRSTESTRLRVRIPSFLMRVERNVPCAGQNDQVLYAVIQGIVVQVMHFLVRLKRSADVLRHNPAGVLGPSSRRATATSSAYACSTSRMALPKTSTTAGTTALPSARSSLRHRALASRAETP